MFILAVLNALANILPMVEENIPRGSCGHLEADTQLPLGFAGSNS